MKLFGMSLLFGILGCAAAGSAPSNRTAAAAASRQEVIAVAERTFLAMRTRDTTTLRRLLAPDLVLISVRSDATGSSQTRRTPVSEFIASVARSREDLVERMWDPRVEVRDDLASLWAPYDFHIGARFSHCGSDAFHMVRSNGEWRVVGLAYTVQTAGCAAVSR